MNIAIFGGSFDPVHVGHEQIARQALKTLNIDKLFVVPTYLNPFKNKFHFEPKIRKELLDKLFKDDKKIEVCNYEIEQNRSVYSIETIKHLRSLYNTNKIYLIIGQDNLENLDKWNNIDEIKSLCTIIVAKRKAYKNEQIKNFETLDTDIAISSSELREKIDIKYIPKTIKDDILHFIKQKR